MIRSKSIGKRYLAGFVIAAALVCPAAVVFATSIGWGEQAVIHQSLDLLVLGLVPAMVALLLARKARMKDETSAAYSSAAIVVLLLAPIVSHFRPLGH